MQNVTKTKIRAKISEVWGRGPQSISLIAGCVSVELGTSIAASTVHTIMHEMGLKPYGKAFAHGYRVRCADGHLVESFGEATVDNFLSKTELKHWPNWRIIGTSCIVDFWLPDYGVGIEYVGLVGHPDYEKRIAEKKQIYEHWNIPIVWVYPETPINSTLIRKIKEVLREYQQRKKETQEVLLK